MSSFVSAVRRMVRGVDVSNSVLLYVERSFDDLYVSMSSDLHILNKWFTRIRLTMNIEKTKFLTFETRNSTNMDRFDEIWFGEEKLLRVEVYKYLSLWIDFRLDFSTHIKRIRKSVAPIIGVLKRIRPYVTAEILDNLFFAYVHSKLSYMVSIWGMATQDRINSLQVLGYSISDSSACPPKVMDFDNFIF
jgi:hypothetical protein